MDANEDEYKPTGLKVNLEHTDPNYQDSDLRVLITRKLDRSETVSQGGFSFEEFESPWNPRTKDENKPTGLKVNLEHTDLNYQDSDLHILITRKLDRPETVSQGGFSFEGFESPWNPRPKVESLEKDSLHVIGMSHYGKTNAETRLEEIQKLKEVGLPHLAQELSDQLEAEQDKVKTLTKQEANKINAETARKPNHAQRASWWIGQMRQIVHQAITRERPPRKRFEVLRFGEVLKCIVSQKVREQVYEPLFEEYKEDYLVNCSNDKTKWQKRRVKLHFVYRIATAVLACWRVTLFARLLKLLWGLMPEGLRNIFKS